MNFHVLTIFPDMINAIGNESILGRAQKSNLIKINAINIRDFSKDKHHNTDDYIFGGGQGMLMTPQPIYDAYKSVEDSLGRKPRIILTSPKGRTFDQKLARELAKEDDLVFICGHYEGVDQRIIDLLEPEEVSIGDYVLTGGELASMIMIDSVARLVPGVLGNEDSHEDESFENGLLEYPQYTRPAEFMGLKVPEVLMSGNHAEIKKWKEQKALEITKERRPDLLDK